MKPSNQSLNNLTLNDLENFLTSDTDVEQASCLLEIKYRLEACTTIENQALLDTFGTWEDNQTDEEIIETIYSNRN